MKLRSRTNELLFLALVAGALLFSRGARAQIAITEMMTARESPADFFELTNFGTNAVDLTGYTFTDADHGDTLYSLPADGLLPVAPGRSVVFVRTNLDVTGFRAFWGACLPSEAQVLSFKAPGFSSFGDSLTLYDSQTNLVDRIEFGRAARTISFVYDTVTGAFGASSKLENGACVTVISNNTASPGRTTGPVPLRIVRQPSSHTQCIELNSTMTVEAIGMPHPRFQWFFNGQPIKGAVESTLIVSNMSPQVEGAYTVLVSNGLSNILSAPAMLSMNRTPSAPTIVSPPLNRAVVEGRTARFEISVCAYPLARYQWFYDGEPLPNETNRVLFIRNCTSDLSGRSYCVRAENQYGSASACGALFVSSFSPIRITELQANPNPGGDGHNDWFEITNFGATPAQLAGYRFSDRYRLTDAQIIKAPIVLRPLESVIFVKNSSVGTFFEWWGPEELPGNLQVTAYTGFSLSARGDSLYLWDETARDPAEYLHSVSYSTNSAGHTLNFETSEFGAESAGGTGHTIEALQCEDIGTPGFTGSWQPGDERPRFISERLYPNDFSSSWRAGLFGGTYRIEVSEDLRSDKWSILRDNFVVDRLGNALIHDYSVSNSPMRFYRIVDVSR